MKTQLTESRILDIANSCGHPVEGLYVGFFQHEVIEFANKIANEPKVGLASNLTDAFIGALEDLAIWKKRALEAEEIIRKLHRAFKDENGPTHMGEAVLQPPQDQELSSNRITSPKSYREG